MELLAKAKRLLSGRNLLLLILLSFTGVTAQAADGGPLAGEVVAVGMTVNDVDRAVDFYSRALCFDKVSDVDVG